MGADGTVYIVEREGNCVRAVDPRHRVDHHHRRHRRQGLFRRRRPGRRKRPSTAPRSWPSIARVTSGSWTPRTTRSGSSMPARRLIRTVAGTGQAGGDGDGGPGDPGQPRPAPRRGRRRPLAVDLDRRHQQPPDPRSPHGPLIAPDSQTGRVVDRIRSLEPSAHAVPPGPIAR